MNIESVGSGGGWCGVVGGGEHFTGIPPPPPRLSSIPAVGVREGGGEVQYLFLLVSAPTLFRNAAASRWNPIGRV